ncbi:MAG: hypothetical protein ACXVP0_18695 [Bacteroidia bacterium]
MELNERQIQIILWDLKKRGVTDPALRDDLLDHLCCLTEEELQQTPDFKTAYIKVRASFAHFRLLQVKASDEIREAGRHTRVYRALDYFLTLFYILLGASALILTPVFFVLYFNEVTLLMVSPLLIFGYIVCFTRINYKTFELIPFK